MAAPLLRQPVEVERLLRDAHAATLQQPPQVLERDGSVHVRAAFREAHADVHDGRARAVHPLQVARLGGDRRRHGRQIRNELGVFVLDRLDHDGAGAADHRAPPVLGPELQVLPRDQLVPQHAAVHGAETRAVASVYDLLRRVGVEVGRGLDAQDERRAARLRQLERAAEVAVGDDRVVGAGGEAEPAAGAGLVHDAHLLAFHRHRVRRAHPDARETGDAELRFDPKIHNTSRRGAGLLDKGRPNMRPRGAPV